MSSPTPIRRADAWVRGCGLALAAAVVVVACKDDRKQTTTEAQVLRCERGVETAVHAETIAEAYDVYYRECSHVYVEPDCQRAFASGATLPYSRRTPTIAEACRQVYCPALASKGLALCMGGWLDDGPALTRDWGSLNEAIIWYDAGELAPRVINAMVRFYAFTRSQRRKSRREPR